MTILIYSYEVNSPSLIAQATYDTMHKLFPSQKILYSCTLDTRDLLSDEGFTIVVPGDNLSVLASHMHENGANKNCKEAVDNNANYIGFCAGAFYGAQQMIGCKESERTYYRFIKDKYSFYEEYLGGALGMIDDTWAIGPFLPDSRALGGKDKTYYHSVLLNDHTTTFPSMYLEGPTFMNQELSGPYANQACIVANYCLPYKPTFEIFSNSGTQQITMENIVPAVLHDVKKGSHRYLIGPHPELTSSARTFIPRFEKTFCPNFLQPMTHQDKNLLLAEDAEEQNFAFLKRTFSK